VDLPPVYVTLVGHIEPGGKYAHCDQYPSFRDLLLQFAAALEPYHVPFNLQIDYEFLLGVSQCETPEMQADTNGQNVLDYLVTRYGFELDPHQNGGWDVEQHDNYADIRYLGGQVSPYFTDTMGGLVWDDPDQWNHLAAGEQGKIYPQFTWHPKALTLAVSSQHHLKDFSLDDTASGVWIPKGPGEDFWTHDPNGPWVYIGPGEGNNWNSEWTQLSTPEYVAHLREQMAAGALPVDRMYTASVPVPEHIIFDPQRVERLLQLLDRLQPMADAGVIVYVSYTQAVAIWQTEYGAQPMIYRRTEAASP